MLSGDAIERLEAAPIEETVVTDTIPLRTERQSGKISMLSVAPLLANAIGRIHKDQSVSELFEEYW